LRRLGFPDGETFEGKSSGESASNPDDELTSAWDSVYGSGHYLAHVLGSPFHGRVVLKGNRGSTLIVETNRETKESAPEGVAKDSNGNIFKVTAG